MTSKINRRTWIQYLLSIFIAAPALAKKAVRKDHPMTNSNRMPSLFIGHGSPMNAIADNPFTQTLVKLGKELPHPKAVVVFSAHWQTKGTYITSAPHPKTIHDFYGFPEELYQQQYRAPGEVDLAQDLAKRFDMKLDEGHWGYDHGNWAVLKFLFPNLDEKVPVLQISLDLNKSDAEHFQFAESLKSLRDEGILFVGSGNVVHNLRLMDRNPQAQAHQWNISFDQWVKQQLDARNFSKDHPLVKDYLFREDGRLSNPSTEHYIPLLYTLGTSYAEDKLKYDYEGYEHASLSMRCVRFS